MTQRQRGVTLMELMVVMAIVGVLAAVAIPSYRQYIIRANRTDAKTQLLAFAQLYERCYTNSTPYAYDSAVCNAAVVLPLTIPSGTYTISTANVTATTFTLTATRLAGQLEDTDCGDLTLTHAGVQGVSGGRAATECWRR